MTTVWASEVTVRFKGTVSPRVSPRDPWFPPWFLGWGGCESPRPLPTPCRSRPPSQDNLSSQSFGTDLPLVDHQVEQHNIFHNEVKAIGPHLAKDGGKVCTVCSGPGPGEGGAHARSTPLPRAVNSVCRSRTANSRPSTRNCW